MSIKNKNKSRILYIVLTSFALFLIMLYFFVWQFLISDSKNNVLFFDDNNVTLIDLEISPENFEYLIDNASEKPTVEAKATVNGRNVGKIGVRVRGSSSLSNALNAEICAFPFELIFNYVNQSKTVGNLSAVKLNTNLEFFDIVAEYMSSRIFSLANIPTPKVGLSFLTVNGIDFGLYNSVECIDFNFIERNFINSDGNLYRNADHLDEDGIETDWFSTVKKANDSWNNKRINELHLLEKRLSENDSIEDSLNVDEFIRYFATVFCSGAKDCMINDKNFFLYEEEGIFSVIPWDMDMSQKIYYFDDFKNEEKYPLVGLLLSDSKYESLFKNYVRSLYENLADHNLLQNTVCRAVRLATPYIERSPLNIYTTDTWKKWFLDSDGNPDINSPGLKAVMLPFNTTLARLSNSRIDSEPIILFEGNEDLENLGKRSAELIEKINSAYKNNKK